LAVGIAVCLLIFVIIQFDLSYDDYHQKKDKIYRVLTEYHHNEPEIFYGKGVPYALPEAIKTAIPQIEESAVVFMDRDTQIIVLDDDGHSLSKFKEPTGVFFTEPGLFSIFDFKWLAGTPDSLKDPNSVVLSKETAIKYFGGWQQAIGKNIKWNNEEVLNVSGILEEVPPNSELQFNVVIAYGTAFTADMKTSDNWDGTNGSFGCFVLLPDDATEAVVNAQLAALARENKSEEVRDSQVLQSLDKIHFDTETGNFNGKTTGHKLINALWIIAAFILLISCVNFINLSTAQAVDRYREIGVRKVLGSNSRQLRAQFLTETFLIVFLAVVLAIGIVMPSLSFFGNLMDMSLQPNQVLRQNVVLFLLLITVAVTLLAGYYPSMVLSRNKAIDVLKGKANTKGSEGITLRRSLVVFQFVIAQGLIFGTLIVVKQMDYFTSQSLGYNRTALVNVDIPTDSLSRGKIGYLQEALIALNGIKNVSFSSDTPTENRGLNNWSKFKFNHEPERTDFFSIAKGVDHAYLSTYDLSLVAGRSIKKADFGYEFLINETLMHALGFDDPDEILNKEIDYYDEVKGPIVGVVKDFNVRSFRDPLSPVFMFNNPNWYSQAGIKLTAKNMGGSLGAIEKLWDNTFPDYVFDYQYLDDKVANYYTQEKKLSQLYKIAAAIAIFLSCLGLYGLASFIVNQRTKEAGIRKVLGATIGNIVYLFSKEYVLLIAISFCIAAPVTAYFMGQWLQTYAYHIDITWVVYVLGGFSALVIAMLTVSYQAFRAARTNPVNSLRTE